MEVIWKDIPNFSSHRISPEGEAISVRTGRRSKGTKTKFGYRIISTGVCGKTKQIFVHRAVYLSFIGDIPKGKVINHIDGNKENNCINNLECVTYKENSIHAIKNGLQPKVLKEIQIQKIMELFKLGTKTGEISKKLNIRPRIITGVINGDSYSHISGIKNRIGNARGSRSSTAKITENQVKEIKLKLLLGHRASEIVREYGFERSFVGKIARNETWKHVTI